MNVLCEVDEFAYDWIVYVVLLAVLAGCYAWRRQRMIAKVTASIDRFPMGFGLENVTLLYWRAARLSPTPEEIVCVQQVFAAAREAWVDMRDRLEKGRYCVWFVRSPEQPVGWRGHGGIEWRDVPRFAGIPETIPGQGYGGLTEYGATDVMYVATYFPGRMMTNLLAHELSHAVPHAREHGADFLVMEARILEAIK